MASKRVSPPAKRAPAKRTRSSSSPLRVVPPPAAPEPPAPAPDAPVTEDGSKPKSLTEAVAGGVYIEILKAQRTALAETAAHGTGTVKIAAHRQLTEISKEIEALNASPNGDGSVVARTADESWDPSAI